MTDPAPRAGDENPDDTVDVFRSRFNVIAAIFAWVLCAVAVVAITTSARGATLVYIAPVAAVAFAVWMVLWRPTVRVSDGGVRLVNVTRTIDIPWEAVIQVDTRFALTLRTPQGRYTATAAPAPGRLNMTFGRAEIIPGRAKIDGQARPSDSSRTDSGAAAYLVRDRWTKLSDAGRIELGVAETTPVRLAWHWRSLAICAILLAVSLLLLALE